MKGKPNQEEEEVEDLVVKEKPNEKEQEVEDLVTKEKLNKKGEEVEDLDMKEKPNEEEEEVEDLVMKKKPNEWSLEQEEPVDAFSSTEGLSMKEPENKEDAIEEPENKEDAIEEPENKQYTERAKEDTKEAEARRREWEILSFPKSPTGVPLIQTPTKGTCVRRIPLDHYFNRQQMVDPRLLLGKRAKPIPWKLIEID
jgi:hypothetical protein